MYYVLVNEVNNKIHKKQFTVHVLLTKNVHLYILIWAQICTFLFKNELCRSCWSRFLVWVKRCDFIQAFVSHNHPYISSSGMADDTLFYCYLCRDGCVKCSHLRCGSCLCTLSASNTSIPCMWTLFASSFIHPSLHLLDFCKKSFS